MAEKQRGRTRALLIEDNPADARLLVEVLADPGGGDLLLEHVTRLSDGVNRLRQGGIDVVLLDLSLPDAKGLEACDRLRGDVPDVPVVVLTGLDDRESALQALWGGAQDYLVKGQVDGQVVMRAVRYAIERQRTLVQLRRQARELRASEARFRNMIVQNADGIVIVDRHGAVRFVNPAAESLFGRTAANLVGGHFDLPTSSDTAEIDILRGEESVSSDAFGGLAAMPEGAYRVSTVQFVTVEVRVAETEWQGETMYLASLRDITARRRAEKERLELAEISSSVNQDLDLEGVCERLADHLIRLVMYDRLEVALMRPDVDRPQLIYASGAEVEGLEPGTLRAGFENGDVSVLGEAAVPPEARAAGFRSWVQVPVGASARPSGYIALGNMRAGMYDEHVLSLLERVAAQVFPAIQNARAHAVALRMTEAHAELDVFPPLESGARASLR